MNETITVTQKVILLGGTYIVDSDRTKPETARGSSLVKNLFKGLFKTWWDKQCWAYTVGHIKNES